MKKIQLAIAASLIVGAVVAPVSVDARSAKRGVAENSFQMRYQMDPLAPGVSWYYNWGQTPSKGYDNEVIDYTGFEFVPMAWNGFNAATIREYCTSHPEAKYILGYNEPNFTNQANMTPAEAAAKWPELVAIANELGLQIVAPALNYSPNPAYSTPESWMDEFAALVGTDAFDYVAIHCYGGLNLMKSMCESFYTRYGKPVWVTEWCNWPGGAGDVYVSPASQISSMIECVQFLETCDYVYRYAWFKAVGPHDSANKPNYGLLINATGYSERELSPQGWVYVYMSEFDRSRYYAVDELFSATDYINSKTVVLAKGNNSASPKPIEISTFNSGAYADYQFDIPSAGTYYLQLTVTGEGESAFFDPKLSVFVVNSDGTKGAEVATAKQFALPGNYTTYNTISLELNLQAGRQILRLADVNPYQQSRVHISTLRLSRSAGIEGVNANSVNGDKVNVYTLSGVILRTDVEPASATAGLAPGYYLVGNRMVLVR